MNTIPPKKCCPGALPIKGAELKALKEQLNIGWKVVRGHHIEKEYAFKDFAQALAFTNKVGALAEKENHHPDIALSWGKVKVILWTHSVGGLSDKDFLFAKKCDLIK
jgi:4a-hydroxytetrahydrobiopterin dehydratase